jgi:hypothetical protein
MGLKDRRTAIELGDSIAITIPFVLIDKERKPKEVTLAADRLMIVDPRGEINEDELLEFLEEHLEPEFWAWYKKRKESKGKKK